ncbi:MAG TPA: hypothetical protein PK819_04880, partial [Thermomicrobiales bacterium]|nr:hypothetical protein [Thermomicrobiales bacterium]
VRVVWNYNQKIRCWTEAVAVPATQAGSSGTTAKWQGRIIVQGSLPDESRGRADHPGRDAWNNIKKAMLTPNP